MTEAPLSGDELQALLDRSPFIRFLGLRFVAADPVRQSLTMTAPMRPEFERGAGSLQWHGGALAAVIDTVGDFALVLTLRRPLPTINFRVDYLRPAIDTGLTAIGIVRRAGRSVGVVDVELLDDSGRLLAIGRANYATAAAGG